MSVLNVVYYKTITFIQIIIKSEKFKEKFKEVQLYTFPMNSNIMLERSVKMRGEIKLDPKIIKNEYLNSAYSELANLIGIDAVLMIHSTYRGQQVFFPVDLFSKDFIKHQIINEYDGNNVRQLALKYGYTEKWIKKILKEVSKKDD